jgi:hypothetical protein
MKVPGKVFNIAWRHIMLIRTHPFGWLTTAIANHLEINPQRISHFLSLSRADWHFAAFIFAHCEEEISDPARFAKIEARLFTTSRRALLREFAPHAAPAILNMLGRMDGKIWRPTTYRKLAVLTQNKASLNWLKHCQRLSRKHVFWLSRLPEQYQVPAVMDRLSLGDRVDELCFAIEVVKRIRTDLSEKEIMRTLEQANKQSLRGWVSRHYTHLCFPPCPWEGNEFLKPLKNFKALQKTALEFKNCLRSYLNRVLQGNSFFYRMEKDGKGIAVVEIYNLAGIGWVVNDCSGHKNANVSAAIKRELTLAFQEAGITTPPPIIDPEYWMDLSFED